MVDRLASKESQVEFMRRHVKAGDSVVDVGAGYGEFSLVLAEIVGKGGSVVAIEPNVKIFQELAIPGTIPRPYDWITPLYAAAGAKESQGTLRFDPRGPGGTQVIDHGFKVWYEDDVQILMLDQIRCLSRPVSFIKIDTEGMDIDVLRGALRLLTKDRPVVMFEWHPEAMVALGKTVADEVFFLNRQVILGLDYTMTDLAGTPVDCDQLVVGDYALTPDERGTGDHTGEVPAPDGRGGVADG